MTPAKNALALWHERLRRGTLGERAQSPATWHYDILWRAACLEAHAADARRQGLPLAEAEWHRRIEALRKEHARAAAPTRTVRDAA